MIDKKIIIDVCAHGLINIYVFLISVQGEGLEEMVL